MTIREFYYKLDDAINKYINEFQNWFLSLTLGEAFIIFSCIIGVIMFYMHSQIKKEEEYSDQF